MIDAQVADAPRTVPLAVTYTHLQTSIGENGNNPSDATKPSLGSP
jgi:hypothetical protein